MARLIRSVVFVQKVLLVVCSLLIAITFGVVVVLRYGFEMNLFAYEEWMMAAAFTLYFIGSAQGRSYEATRRPALRCRSDHPHKERRYAPHERNRRAGRRGV